MANLYKKGSIRHIALYEKVCIFFLALSMTILRVSPENRQIGEYFEGWPGFTKPNLPALPPARNIWSSL